jgi:diaminopimelate epimerase
METEIIIADPAGKITIFVLSPVENRLETAQKLLAEPGLKAEQIGFVTRPLGTWRLDMMGGEVCGNAARGFGLFAAVTEGLRGKAAIPIEISGMKGPLMVNADTGLSTAEVEIPGPSAGFALEWKGMNLPVCVFDGISHVIAPGLAPEEKVFYEIKQSLETRGHRPDALGVLFWDESSSRMTPAVYVYATDSLVFESSCGSGSAAMAVHLGSSFDDGEALRGIVQPGGTIETKIHKRKGEVVSVSIGGKVYLSKKMIYRHA